VADLRVHRYDQSHRAPARETVAPHRERGHDATYTGHGRSVTLARGKTTKEAGPAPEGPRSERRNRSRLKVAITTRLFVLCILRPV